MTKTNDMTRDQRRALLHIQRGKNVLITGGAGTGKSFLLSQAVQILQDSGKTVAICAPTGKAALDIGGITVHSLFGFPAGPCIQIDQSGPHILVRNSALLNKADVLVMSSHF